MFIERISPAKFEVAFEKDPETGTAESRVAARAIYRHWQAKVAEAKPKDVGDVIVDLFREGSGRLANSIKDYCIDPRNNTLSEGLMEFGVEELGQLYDVLIDFARNTKADAGMCMGPESEGPASTRIEEGGVATIMMQAIDLALPERVVAAQQEPIFGFH
jgi:hypothetical protein